MRVGLGFLGAFVASAIGGNAPTPTYGNAHIAPRVLLLHTLTMALPVASPPSRCTCWRAAGRPGWPSTRSASWPRGSRG
jgi:hypothetical protein